MQLEVPYRILCVRELSLRAEPKTMLYLCAAHLSVVAAIMITKAYGAY